MINITSLLDCPHGCPWATPYVTPRRQHDRTTGRSSRLS